MQRKIKSIITILILTMSSIGLLSAQGLYNNNRNEGDIKESTAGVSHGLFSEDQKFAPPSVGGDANKEVPIGDAYWILIGLVVVYSYIRKIKNDKRIKN